MKTYLEFSILGEITELKTKYKFIDINNFNFYNTLEKISYNNYYYILLINNNNPNNKNISVLPFYNKEIYGSFLLFKIDKDDNIISFKEKNFLNLLNKNNTFEDYSSDDFDLSE
jgi:hypothetical protein